MIHLRKRIAGVGGDRYLFSISPRTCFTYWGEFSSPTGSYAAPSYTTPGSESAGCFGKRH